MSRSFKKNVWVKDKNKGMKRLANKRVRQAMKKDKVDCGSHYKKHFNSYDISDFKFDCSFEEFLKWHWTRDMDIQESLAEWERMFRSK